MLEFNETLGLGQSRSLKVSLFSENLLVNPVDVAVDGVNATVRVSKVTGKSIKVYLGLLSSIVLSQLSLGIDSGGSRVVWVDCISLLTNLGYFLRGEMRNNAHRSHLSRVSQLDTTIGSHMRPTIGVSTGRLFSEVLTAFKPGTKTSRLMSIKTTVNSDDITPNLLVANVLCDWLG